ncbi:MAG: DUF3618 domain-containing protein [Mycobacteriales bacterium]
MSDQTTDALRAQIATHRAELAQTVELLAAKLDVKTRASAKARELTPLLIKVGAGAAGLAVVVVAVRRFRR